MTQPAESLGPFRVVREDGAVSLTGRRSMLPVLWWCCTAALLLIIPAPFVTGGFDLMRGIDIAALPAGILGALMIIMATMIGDRERGRGVITYLRTRLAIRRRSAAPGYRDSPVEPRLTVDGRSFSLADVKRVMVDHYIETDGEGEKHIVPVYIVLPHEVIRVYDYGTESEARELARWLCTEIGLEGEPDIRKVTLGPNFAGATALIKKLLQLVGVGGILVAVTRVTVQPDPTAVMLPMVILSCGSIAWGWIMRLVLGNTSRSAVAEYARSHFGITPR